MSRKSISAIISVFIIFFLTLTVSGVCEANPQNRFAYISSRNGSNLTVTVNFAQESFDGLDTELYRPRILELWPQWQNTYLQLVSIELGQAAIFADKELIQTTRVTPENAGWSEARAIIMNAGNTNRVAPGDVLILTFNILQTSPSVFKWRVDRTVIAPAEAQGYLALNEGTFQPYRISGTVKDASTNSGIPSATVIVKDASNTVIATLSTDVSGNYTNAVAIPGDYYVVASKTGYDDFNPPSYPIEISDTSPNAVFNTSLTLAATPPVIPVTLGLAPGWNFISFPKDPSPNNTIGEVLKEVSPNVRIVWGYDNTTKSWLKYKPGAGGTLTAMISGLGYWVYMDAGGTITMTNWAAPPTSITIYPGWNLVGYNGTSSTVAAALIGIIEEWTIIWNWMNSTWYAHRSDGQQIPAPDLQTMEQKKAYWIKIKPGQATGWVQ